jgi:hypothetical protein
VSRRGCLLLAAALFGAVAARAQNPPRREPAAPAPRAAPDTTASARPDTGRAVPAAGRDTVPRPDSLAPDSFLPELPRLGPPPGPLPRSIRIVFDRDSLWYSGAFTLGELLQRVPGVFLVRGGWYGQPEVIQYAGQGTSSVQVFWDGYAMDPMGPDSSGIDVGTISLGLLKRVEVERLPTLLRVYLISDDQPLHRARTETSFATGDASTNTYRIRYLNHWPSGLGIGLGVEDLGTGAANFGSGGSNSVTLWAKASWAPSPRFGIAYQATSVAVNRTRFSAGGLTLSDGSKNHRTDLVLRGFAASRPDGMGLRLDALVGSTSYTDTLPGSTLNELQAATTLGYRSAFWSLEGTARLRDTDTPFDLQLRAAAAPLGPLTLAASYESRTLLGGRHWRDAALEAEFRPFSPLAVHGAVRHRDVMDPGSPVDTAQRVTDLEGGVSLTTRLLDLDVSVAQHGSYAPPVYGTFGDTALTYLTYSGLAVRTATVSFAFWPTRFLSVAGWYRRPLDAATAAYEPPDHSRIAATFRTRLLPVLRRGAFDFTAQVAMEGWGRGTAGDSAGTVLTLAGATYVDYRVELRLVKAAIFWTMRNAVNAHYSLISGIRMPSAAQRYGVRWEFTN